MGMIANLNGRAAVREEAKKTVYVAAVPQTTAGDSYNSVLGGSEELGSRNASRRVEIGYGHPACEDDEASEKDVMQRV